MISLGGVVLTRAVFSEPFKGVWFASCETTAPEDFAPDDRGLFELVMGSRSLFGTIVNPQGQTPSGGTKRVEVVGGFGGWGQSATPKPYQSQAGVTSRAVAQDAATDAGEVLKAFAPKLDRLGTYYSRTDAAYAQALSDAASGSAWWVADDGETVVGDRDASDVDTLKVSVLDYDQETDRVLLAVTDPADVVAGQTLRFPELPMPFVIRTLDLSFKASGTTASAWVGGDGSESDDLEAALLPLIRRAIKQRLFGVYRYVVTQVAGDYVNLRVVDASTGVPPSLSKVEQWIAGGIHTTPKRGSQVLVAFVDGKRTEPVVCGMASRPSANSEPDAIDIGGSGTQKLARVGDTVTVNFPPLMVFTGTVGGSPATGTIAAAQQAIGQINTGCNVAGGK
jgi:hypothetical protein